MGKLGDGPGKLDAGRTAADDDEGQQRGARRRVGLPLGLLEGEKQPAANGGRVLKRLQSRSELFPFVVAEIGMARAGCQHERVVADLPAIGEPHFFSSASTPVTVPNRVVMFL